MAYGKHKTSAKPGTTGYSAAWSGVSYAPHCGCICPECGEQVHIEGDSHYCPHCDDYVNTGRFCEQSEHETDYSEILG